MILFTYSHAHTILCSIRLPHPLRRFRSGRRAELHVLRGLTVPGASGNRSMRQRVRLISGNLRASRRGARQSIAETVPLGKKRQTAAAGARKLESYRIQQNQEHCVLCCRCFEISVYQGSSGKQWTEIKQKNASCPKIPSERGVHGARVLHQKQLCEKLSLWQSSKIKRKCINAVNA